MCADYVNSLGLFLDIVGVVLLFFFGLPPGINAGGGSTIVTRATERQKRTARIYVCLSWAALAIIVSGFALQIVSNHI